jgi:hypothetical protein
VVAILDAASGQLIISNQSSLRYEHEATARDIWLKQATPLVRM